MALRRRHGDVVRSDGGSHANELISLSCHTGTHIDACCHHSFMGKLHGGVDAQQAAVGGKFSQLGAETIGPIVSRGVLIDAATALDVDCLPPSAELSASDLEFACASLGITVQAGDTVLVRTGWAKHRVIDPATYVGTATGLPGVNESGARWLADKAVRATGSDTLFFEWIPPGGPAHLPAHRVLLVENAIHILEALDLEELALARAREFVMVTAPLRIRGATGSPVCPLALVDSIQAVRARESQQRP
jgi:kynurenine formamidase